MCIAVPVTILSVEGGQAFAEAAGGRLRVDARLVPEIKPGDKALVHAGCAIGILSEEEAAGLDAILADLMP